MTEGKKFPNVLIVLERLVRNGDDPSACGNYAIKSACRYGHTEFVEYILQDPRVDPTVDDYISLRNSINYNHMDIVNLLIRDNRMDPKYCGDILGKFNEVIKQKIYDMEKEFPLIDSSLQHIDNFELIQSLLDQNPSEDDFYFVQIIKRKKENPQMKEHNLIMASFYIKSLEDVSMFSRISKECYIHNARAYIHLNKRSYKKVAFENLESLVKKIKEEDYKNCSSLYKHSCGVSCHETNKKWIIDFDSKNIEELESLKNKLSEICNGTNLRGQPGPELITTVPTLNGYHLIVKPFDPRLLQMNLDIHKDQPTLLYYKHPHI